MTSITSKKLQLVYFIIFAVFLWLMVCEFNMENIGERHMPCVFVLVMSRDDVWAGEIDGPSI